MLPRLQRLPSPVLTLSTVGHSKAKTNIEVLTHRRQRHHHHHQRHRADQYRQHNSVFQQKHVQQHDMHHQKPKKAKKFISSVNLTRSKARPTPLISSTRLAQAVPGSLSLTSSSMQQSSSKARSKSVTIRQCSYVTPVIRAS